MRSELPPNRLGELIRRDQVKGWILAGHCHVDQRTVARWRRGDTPIPDAQKFRLAEYFNVSIPYLMGWDDNGEEAA